MIPVKRADCGKGRVGDGRRRTRRRGVYDTVIGEAKDLAYPYADHPVCRWVDSQRGC